MRARHAELALEIGGVSIGAEALKDVLSLTWTDNEDSQTDDLTVTIADPAGKWLETWMDAAVQATASCGVDGKGSVTLAASIAQANWEGEWESLKTLDCGQFVLDGCAHSGPPSVIRLQGTSLGYDTGLRQEKRSKAWEAYALSGIAREMAANAGLELTYLSGYDPYYERQEQSEESDIVFLQALAEAAGLSVKISDGQLILLDQQAYEAQAPVATIDRTDMTRWNFSTEECDTQYGACTVSFWDPAQGQLLTATYTDPDRQEGDVRTLTVRAAVASVGEALSLAQRLLRLKNQYEYAASLTLAGDVRLLAGLTVTLTGCGAWNGKYLITRAVHAIAGGGYTTRLELRRCLEGY